MYLAGTNLDVKSVCHVLDGASPGNQEQQDACVRLRHHLLLAVPVQRHHH